MAYDGNGDSLRPVLGRSVAGGVTIPVPHFSGYGWVWALLDESYWIHWMRFQQAQAEAQLQAQFAAVVAMNRQRALRGQPAGNLDDLVAAFISSWYDVVYEPRMAVAQRSCTDGRAAATALVTLWRVLQLAGVDVNQVYQQLASFRSAAGRPLAYPFQTWPPNFIRNVTYHCDDEAVKECARTGDLTRLLTYIRDRSEYFRLSGGPPPQVAKDDYLVDLCARYEVRFDATASYDGTSYFPDGVPAGEDYEQWRITATVRLRWHPLSADSPWLGEVAGVAVPTSNLLLSQTRQRKTHGGDRGNVDEGWGPWYACQSTEGPWGSWALRLASLDFRRHDYDQTTLAFKSAKVVFGPVSFTQGTSRLACANGSGIATSNGGGVSARFLVQASPADIGWRNQADDVSLAENQLSSWQAGTYPVLGIVDWSNTNQVKEGLSLWVWQEEGHIELVHTPAQ